ncbi:MAG TPA: enoyl-CoA hydratase/isomerase family protein [Acidimicrobiia bacterium]|nr:enoyl-CoA hydratase/isomerase family protein [Acidimicrobiia bacterium]
MVRVGRPDGAGVVRVVIDRPPVNALDGELIAELEAAARDLHGAPGVRVVVVSSGLGAVFMAGADLGFIEAQWHRIAEVAAALRSAFSAWAALPVPTVGALGGHALGGGCELALTLDFRCMARGRARIGLPEARRGLLAAGGGAQRLARLVGTGRALDLALRGRVLDADEAERIGLVTTACDAGDLDATVDALAAELAELAPLTLAATKAVIRAGADRPLEEALTMEIDAMVALTATEDAAEGVRSFLEGRAPRFGAR